jgi:hypothetical protein
VAESEGPVFLKKVRNGGIFRVPREIKIHRLAMEAQAEHGPFTARLLGYRRGIFSSVLHIERLEGPSPKHIGELSDVGALIARVEANTNRLFKFRRVAIDPKLDFYLSGARYGRRYDVSSIAGAYRRNNQPPFPEFEELVQRCATSIARNEALLVGAEPVLSHLDHLAKNFIRTGEGVFLIDWGEGYIGRRGFDAGSFLMVLLRSYDASRFESEATLFCRSYLERALDGPDVLAAINRVFIPRSLWYFLRPDIISRFQAIGKLDEWRAKLLILGRFASGQFWQEAGLSGGERSTTH